VLVFSGTKTYSHAILDKASALLPLFHRIKINILNTDDEHNYFKLVTNKHISNEQ